MFSKYPDTSEKMAHQYNILKGHETAHILATPNENSPLAKILDKDDYFVKNGGTEISARGTQLKNYFDKKTISKDELKYASEHYIDDTGVDNIFAFGSHVNLHGDTINIADYGLDGNSAFYMISNRNSAATSSINAAGIVTRPRNVALLAIIKI